MAETFADLIPNAVTFLADLKANNSRDWFNDNKSTYEASVKTPGLALGAFMADRIHEFAGVRPAVKLYRPHRDVRFSKDKTPYNTHLHLLWSKGEGAAWFFGVSPDYISVGVGMRGFSKTELDRYRVFVDADDGGISAIISNLQGDGFRLDEPPLKRVPAPFDKDHPRGTLLRRKGLALWRDHGSAPDDLPKALMEVFQRLDPIREFCDRVAD